MFNILQREQIGEGIFLTRITDPRFKINKITVSFLTEIEDSTRADHALVPYILTDSCEDYPDYKSFGTKLSEMYGTNFNHDITIFGDLRCTSIHISTIDDRYTLEGEKLEQECARILTGALFRPLTENGAFSARTVDVLKNELIDAIDGVINDKRGYAARKGAEYAFRGEPLEKHILGTHEQAEQVSPLSAYSAYKSMLTHGRIEIFAAGASDFSQAREEFIAAFSQLERSDVVKLEFKPSKLKEEPLRVTEEISMQQAVIRMYFKAPEANDRFALAVMSMILGGMATSRFFTNIREKQSLCYYCSCFSNRFSKVLTTYAGVEPSNIERTQQAILDEIKQLADNGITAEELEHAKSEILNDAVAVYDLPGSISSWYFGQIGDPQFYTPEQFAQELCKVTPDRVQAVCRLFKPDTFFTLCPKEEQL